MPEPNFDPLVGELEHALNAGKLPMEYSEWGTQLLQRLRQPVQVAVAGRAGTGKSALIDMLLGNVVIGKKTSGIIIEVCQGTDELAVFETSAGQHLRKPGRLAELEIPQDTVRARQYLPDPRLCWHSYTEIPIAGPDSRQNGLLQQAAAAMDVFLWCSPDFGPQERELWSAVPDNVKDHSFLVLAMADRQAMRGTLAAQIAELEPVAAEEFLGVYPVAAIQGLRAQTSGGPDGAKLWRSSGGRQLFDDVMQQVELGRGSDVDQAELLIRKCGTGLGTGSQVQVENAATPVLEQGKHGLESALELLQQRAEDMLADAESAGGPDTGVVLDRCVEVIRDLSDTLAEAPGGPAVAAAREAVQDGEELLMLCQIEQTEDAAADAVTLLLQIKKELAEDVART